MNRIWVHLTAFAACMAFLLSGCVAVNYSVTNRATIAGNGRRISQSYEVEPFSAINIGLGFTVTYTEGAECKVEVEAPENYLSHIRVSTSNGQLLVSANALLESPSGNDAPKIHITAPTLSEIILSGGVVMQQADTIHSQSLFITLSGASVLELPVEVEELIVDNSGASAITLSGRANHAEFLLSGASALVGEDLQTSTASVDLSGMGSCSIRCSDQLDAEISGMGEIEYYGDPIVNSDISGMGSIDKIG